MTVQDAFKGTFNTIVSDLFLESIKETVKAMRQIVAAGHFPQFRLESGRISNNHPFPEIPESRLHAENEMTSKREQKKEVPQITVGLIRKVQTYGE